MKPSPQKYHPEQAERRVAARRYRVVMPDGRVISGSDDRETSERNAAVVGHGAHVVGE